MAAQENKFEESSESAAQKKNFEESLKLATAKNALEESDKLAAQEEQLEESYKLSAQKKELDESLKPATQKKELNVVHEKAAQMTSPAQVKEVGQCLCEKAIFTKLKVLFSLLQNEVLHCRDQDNDDSPQRMAARVRQIEDTLALLQAEQGQGLVSMRHSAPQDSLAKQDPDDLAGVSEGDAQSSARTCTAEEDVQPKGKPCGKCTRVSELVYEELSVRSSAQESVDSAYELALLELSELWRMHGHEVNEVGDDALSLARGLYDNMLAIPAWDRPWRRQAAVASLQSLHIFKDGLEDLQYMEDAIDTKRIAMETLLRELDKRDALLIQQMEMRSAYLFERFFGPRRLGKLCLQNICEFLGRPPATASGRRMPRFVATLVAFWDERY